jgi:hypothetical protein
MSTRITKIEGSDGQLFYLGDNHGNMTGISKNQKVRIDLRGKTISMEIGNELSDKRSFCENLKHVEIDGVVCEHSEARQRLQSIFNDAADFVMHYNDI